MQHSKTNKVLIFSFTYFPFIGGAEVALKEITARIKDIQFDIITARLDKKLAKEETAGNVNIYRVGKGNKLDKIFYPIRAFLFAIKLHKKNNYPLIWAMMANWAGMAALLFKLTHRKVNPHTKDFGVGVKYLLTLQSGDSDFFLWLRTWFWYPFYRMVYTKADHIQVISGWLEKRARRYGYKGDISVVPNGVSLKMQETINREQGDSFKNKLNISENSKIILTASRLVKKNDIKSLIKSIHLLITHYSLPITLLIAGSGKLETRLKNLTKNLKIEGNVIFLGNVKHNQVFKYYSIADVFVRPSLSEGMGISFIEAMAAGVPIIGTRVGGIPDFLEDKKTGLFCKVKDPQDLAEKIKLLLEDESLYREIRDNGLKLTEKYDWDLIGESMRKIIDNLIVHNS
ncbi:MAG: glycosyltransferase family 4 protein [Candidatus Kuenenbacteria bacterium]